MAKQTKEQEDEVDYNQDFKEHDFARAAAIAEQSKDENIYGSVLPSLTAFYSQYKMGQRSLLANPFISAGFINAAQDLKETGRIGNRDFLRALAVHNQTYDEALNNVTIKTVIERAEANGYEVSNDFKETIKKYIPMTLKELKEVSKKDKAAGVIYSAMQRIDLTKFYGSLLGKAFNEQTSGELENIVTQFKQKDSKKR